MKQILSIVSCKNKQHPEHSPYAVTSPDGKDCPIPLNECRNFVGVISNNLKRTSGPPTILEATRQP